METKIFKAVNFILYYKILSDLCFTASEEMLSSFIPTHFYNFFFEVLSLVLACLPIAFKLLLNKKTNMSLFYCYLLLFLYFIILNVVRTIYI